jgi:hypothetical protein
MKDPFITLITNEPMDSDCMGCPKMDAWGPMAVYLWNKLFKLRPEIQELADQQYRRLFGASNLPYVAVHLRLGGMTGELTQTDSISEADVTPLQGGAGSKEKVPDFHPN